MVSGHRGPGRTVRVDAALAETDFCASAVRARRRSNRVAGHFECHPGVLSECARVTPKTRKTFHPHRAAASGAAGGAAVGARASRPDRVATERAARPDFAVPETRDDLDGELALTGAGAGIADPRAPPRRSGARAGRRLRSLGYRSARRPARRGAVVHDS